MKQKCKVCGTTFETKLLMKVYVLDNGNFKCPNCGKEVIKIVED